MSTPPLDGRVRRGLEAQLAALRERVARGERRVGWKVALNDPRVQEALQISAPVIGFLTAGGEVRSGDTHSLAGATRVAVEPEIAVYVGRGGTVAALGTALEVIDVDLPFDDLALILERNVFHRAFALGAAAWGASSIQGMTATFTRDGEQQQSIDVAAAAMQPDAVIELVHGCLSAVGDALREGDVIISGSLVAALPTDGGERFGLDVDGLEPVSLELGSA